MCSAGPQFSIGPYHLPIRAMAYPVAYPVDNITKACYGCRAAGVVYHDNRVEQIEGYPKCLTRSGSSYWPWLP
jgi:hypothetical protein